MAYKPRVLAQSDGGSGSPNFSGNMTLIQSQTAVNVANLAFTTGVTGFDIFYLSFYGVTFQTNAQGLLAQVSTNLGVSWITTGYSTQTMFSTGVSASGSPDTNAGFTLSISNENGDSTIPLCGYSRFFNFASSTFKKQTIGGSNQAHASTTNILEYVTGLNTTTAVCNALNILTTSGNILTGTFKLYGVVN